MPYRWIGLGHMDNKYKWIEPKPETRCMPFCMRSYLVRERNFFLTY